MCYNIARVVNCIAAFLLKGALFLNDALLTLIGLAAILFVPLWALKTLASRRLWHCSECGFETYEEHEAIGHREYHKLKHTIYQD